MGTFGTMPNLKELKISVGKIPLFNLAAQLHKNIGLEHLRLVLQAGKLRTELQSSLPPTLNRITIEASKIPILHPAAFKVNIFTIFISNSLLRTLLMLLYIDFLHCPTSTQSFVCLTANYLNKM